MGDRARSGSRHNCTWEIVAEQVRRRLSRRLTARHCPKHCLTWKQHRTRLERIIALTPPGGPKDAVLEMGTYLHLPAALKTLGYGDVRGTFLGKAGKTEQHRNCFARWIARSLAP